MAVPVVTSVDHVAQNCVKVTFSEVMRNDAELRDAANYYFMGGSPPTVTAVVLPTTHTQPYTGGSANGGKPQWIYLITDSDVYVSGSAIVALSLGSSVVDYYGGLSVLGGQPVAFTAVEFRAPDYWTADSLMVREVKREIGRVGRIKV